MPGLLYICATPIGNLGDASRRLGDVLANVDVIYAEDTRRGAKLLASLEVSTPLRSYFTGNERRRSDDLEADLRAGKNVAVISDAGTPAVSDPGRLAVEAARRVEAEVVVIPGPSAVTAAVAASGMVDGRFVFEGFLERKGEGRRSQLAAIASDLRPSVLFVSPHRLVSDLADLVEVCGPGRQVFVGRELTKLHEETWWGSLSEALTRWEGQQVRGELTLVVAGGEAPPPDPVEAESMARELVAEGLSPSQAARQASAATGVPRREIYDVLVR